MVNGTGFIARAGRVLGIILLFAATVWPETPTQAATTAPEISDGVLRATLPNGLRVVIVANSLAPVVSTAVNYLAGSDESPAGFPGMAHAQEHMMFRGSPGLSADQLANIGSIMGGNFNANTQEGVTQYLYTVPSEDIDVALNIEALRMRDVFDTAEDWAEERGALEQEVEQDLSSPSYVLYAKLRAIMFEGTPYAHDALGSKASFDKTTAAQIKAFHDAWYAPNNAILVIAGNVDLKASYAKVEQLFGPIPRKDIPARPSIALKPLKSTSFSLPTDDPNGTQVLAMRMTGQNSEDFPALEVLQDVLESQRFDLYGLVAEGKAITTDFTLDPLPEAGMCYVTVTFPASGNAKAIDAAIRKILQKLARDGVPPELFAAAKLKERRETEFQKNSISDLASLWSEGIAQFNLASPEADLVRIENVTLADVNRVARKYLDLGHAISATLVPHGGGDAVTARSGFGGEETIALGEAKSPDLPDWAEAALSALTPPESTIHPIVSKLENGLTLIIQPEDVSDTVTVYGHIRNRPEAEEVDGKEGASLVLNQLLTFGTEHLDRVAYQRALDDIGATEDAGTDFDIKVLAPYFDRGVELLADNELSPALPDAALGPLKAQIAETVAARNRSPDHLTQEALLDALNPGYDMSERDATPQSVRRLTRADIKFYYNRVFRPDLTTLVVIGKIDPPHAREVVEKYFGGWTSHGPRPRLDSYKPPDNTPSIITVPDDSRVQTSVVMAQNLALARSDPDYYALQLGSTVLGGGFYSTRLSIDLRKNRGLVYSVDSDLQADRARGIFLVQYASDPQDVTKAADIVTQELTRMIDAPVGEDELSRAKALLLRQIPLGQSSVDQIAVSFTTNSDLDLPLDEAVVAARRYIVLTPADVQAAFRKWIRPHDLIRASQGPTQ